MAEEAILGHLEKNDEISDSGDFASQSGIDHNEIVNVIKSLHGFRLVDAQDIKREKWVLTDEGKLYAAAGSPEVQLFLAVPPEGISREELQRKVDPSVYKIGCSQAIKNKWLEIGKQQVSRKVQQVEDTAKDLLTRVQNEEALSQADIDALKRRKLIAPQGDWKELEFKEYNFNAKGQPAEGGHLHPLLKVRRQLQMIFLQMGFEEMPTNNFVESSFWNFDALFQPQQHPARDSHDTFFLQAPSTTKMLPEDYVERVKHVHEHGGYGSRGYGYDWKREEANKNLLRTHTTAVSSRMLYLLAQV
ncbi:Phenylalanine--tRNA ligase alpha subunit, cytoplasmic [Vitis vinifera]|uniref:Phenylalanine--tRNA ligase alpha subunit, cytoplasmic n=1 Tax=Vitis vinifera TaxID=29760 RepID=A0A438C0W5_VITVI|nr:Phenylalanine--tRNA ligase alpha subunit, cytoplasmic [Vitis vinifera]